MKALTLWQPWASLMAFKNGPRKRIETRSWSTKYRGDIVICAAKSFNAQSRQAIDGHMFRQAFRYHGVDPKVLPRGAALCKVRLLDCIKAEHLLHDDASNEIAVLREEYLGVRGIDDPDAMQWIYEFAFGNYAPGRFAWLTTDLEVFDKTVPVIGHQGLWNWQDQRDTP